MKILTGLMMSLSLLLTACGEFQTINKDSNEVLSALTPYLSEEDQKLAAELSYNYNEPIQIRENLMDASTLEIEIEGHIAQLEVINKGRIAFRLNGKNISFEDLKNNDVLESVIASSLVKISSNSGAVMSIMSVKKSEAFLGSLLSSVFSLVVKGIFNYAVEKVTEKAGSVIGGAVGTIGNSVVDNVTGEQTTSKDQVKTAKNTILNTILNAVLNRITGGTVQLPSTQNPSQPPSAEQPQQNCNLFCSLVGLLVNNLIK